MEISADKEIESLSCTDVQDDRLFNVPLRKRHVFWVRLGVKIAEVLNSNWIRLNYNKLAFPRNFDSIKSVSGRIIIGMVQNRRIMPSYVRYAAKELITKICSCSDPKALERLEHRSFTVHTVNRIQLQEKKTTSENHSTSDELTLKNMILQGRFTSTEELAQSLKETRQLTLLMEVVGRPDFYAKMFAYLLESTINIKQEDIIENDLHITLPPPPPISMSQKERDFYPEEDPAPELRTEWCLNRLPFIQELPESLMLDGYFKTLPAYDEEIIVDVEKTMLKSRPRRDESYYEPRIQKRRITSKENVAIAEKVESPKKEKKRSAELVEDSEEEDDTNEKDQSENNEEEIIRGWKPSKFITKNPSYVSEIVIGITQSLLAAEPIQIASRNKEIATPLAFLQKLFQSIQNPSIDENTLFHTVKKLASTYNLNKLVECLPEKKEGEEEREEEEEPQKLLKKAESPDVKDFKVAAKVKELEHDKKEMDLEVNDVQLQPTQASEELDIEKPLSPGSSLDVFLEKYPWVHNKESSTMYKKLQAYIFSKGFKELAPAIAAVEADTELTKKERKALLKVQNHKTMNKFIIDLNVSTA